MRAIKKSSVYSVYSVYNNNRVPGPSGTGVPAERMATRPLPSLPKIVIAVCCFPAGAPGENQSRIIDSRRVLFSCAFPYGRTDFPDSPESDSVPRGPAHIRPVRIREGVGIKDTGVFRMLYIRCPHCGRRVPRGEKCECNYKREYPEAAGDKRLYHTARWTKLRAMILSLYNGLDPYAMAHGRIEYADTVHHIVPAGDDIRLFWRPDNLIPVSRHSHDEIHAAYGSGERAKAEMQSELRGLVKLPDVLST